MSVQDPRQRRNRLAAAAERAASQVDLGWSGRGKRRAEPGDLYVLPATSELPVEWALLERHPGQPQLFLAVPADTCPLAGSADLALPEEGERGALTLRCRAQVWLHEDTLDPDLYTGSLGSGAIEQAREIVRRAAEGQLEPGPEDARPAYRDWLQEVVAPAGAAVGTLVPHSLPGRRPGARRWLPVAASILLGVSTLGLSGWVFRQQDRIDGLSGERDAARATREREQSASLERQLAAALRDKGRLERELRREDPPRPVVDPPLAFLDPAGSLRGAPGTIHLPREAPFLVLVLQLPEEGDAPAYRLTLQRQGSAATVWRSDPFRSSGTDEIRLALPRQLLAPGEYRLRLHGRRGGDERRLADYALLIAP